MTIAPLPSASAHRFDLPDLLDDLRAQVSGQLIVAGSVEYDTARRVHNITVDRRPLAIVRAANADDVAAAVTFARDNIYPLAVRSGGHSVAFHSMVDDAIVIDLSAMKQIEIDPVARIARVQAGATSGDLAGPAAEHGLALSTGDTSSVGMGGLTTGGGIGFMARKHGLAIDNLIAAQVVTASGAIVTASDQEHADLFWAIRGGGGNFGIVTEFVFRLAPVGQILGGDLLLPASREVIRGYLEYSVQAPDGLSTIAHLMYAPPAPFVPEASVGQLVVGIIVCWTGSVEDGERAIAPLRALAEPVADTIRPMPYPDIYLSTAHQAQPIGAVLRSMFSDDLSDETLDAFLTVMAEASSPYSVIHLRGLGGAMGRVSPDATAFAHRDQRYLVAVIGVWLDPAEDPAVHISWADSVWNQVRHERRGAYVNFIGDEGKERLHDAYPPKTLSRLARVKRMYDPLNLFRFNHNIQP